MASPRTSSRERRRVEVSAVMVTTAQPFAGMFWLMVRMFTPVPANTFSTPDRMPGSSFNRIWNVTMRP